MTIRAVVFDIGGVLEITPDLGVTRHWERRLGLRSWPTCGASTSAPPTPSWTPKSCSAPEGKVEAESSYDRTQATGPQLHLLDRPADQRGGRAGGLRQSAGRG